MGQVLWVFGVGLPVYILNSQDPSREVPLGFINAVDIVGWVIWAFGFGIEIVADRQKDVFKTKYPRDFIRTGLWKFSRHPNYFGECKFFMFWRWD